MTQMQGIVSILGSDNPEKTSLRRTLSADMSSKRWMADNGLPPIKKIASSQQFVVDSDEEECDVVGKGDPNPDPNPSRMDIWTAIMSQKKDDCTKLPPPYVHPLVMKKASSLSEKSLKVCTESLGSETGSEIFSLTPVSDTCVNKQPKEKQEENEKYEEKEGKEEKEVRACYDKVVKVACMTTKKSQQARNSFPPPIQSLAAARTDGPTVQVHSRRVDGRLVLEAVSVQQQKYFEAQREDGRFRLTLINDPKETASDEKEENKIEINLIKKQIEILNYGSIKSGWSTPVITEKFTEKITGKNPKSVVRIKRILDRDNENPWWSPKLNTKEEKIMAHLEVVEEEESPIAQSPPPRTRLTSGRPPLPPPPPATFTVNCYEYFWRAKPTVASVIDPLITQHRPPTKTKELVLLRGNKADCFLPSLKGCKEPRRSALMWEPFCIATS